MWSIAALERSSIFWRENLSVEATDLEMLRSDKEGARMGVLLPGKPSWGGASGRPSSKKEWESKITR